VGIDLYSSFAANLPPFHKASGLQVLDLPFGAENKIEIYMWGEDVHQKCKNNNSIAKRGGL
jgi:hypothetical protein